MRYDYCKVVDGRTFNMAMSSAKRAVPIRWGLISPFHQLEVLSPRNDPARHALRISRASRILRRRELSRSRPATFGLRGRGAGGGQAIEEFAGGLVVGVLRHQFAPEGLGEEGRGQLLDALAGGGVAGF